MSRNGLTWKLFALIVSTDAANSFAQLFMKKGLTEPAAALTDFKALFDFITGNIHSPLMWLGIAIYALSFFLWVIVLSRVELSVAMPIASTDYVIIPLLAIIFLKETVSPLRWIAIATIVVGIYFVSKSGKHIPVEGRAP
jgi:drug/metabolite transporter (DMT)-like permease